MPTVLNIKGYRFFFFSDEGNEPMHIHIEKGEKYAKYWIQPISLARNKNFRAHELTEIKKIIIENIDKFEVKWNEYFNN